jgi:hypothetical protein
MVKGTSNFSSQLLLIRSISCSVHGGEGEGGETEADLVSYRLLIPTEYLLQKGPSLCAYYIQPIFVTLQPNLFFKSNIIPNLIRVPQRKIPFNLTTLPPDPSY